MPCLGYLTCVPGKLMRQWHNVPPAELAVHISDACLDHSEARFDLQLWWDDLDRVFGGDLTPISGHDESYPLSHIVFEIGRAHV